MRASPVAAREPARIDGGEGLPMPLLFRPCSSNSTFSAFARLGGKAPFPSTVSFSDEVPAFQAGLIVVFLVLRAFRQLNLGLRHLLEGNEAENDDAPPLLLDPVLQVTKLNLELAQLGLIGLALHLLHLLVMAMARPA